MAYAEAVFLVDHQQTEITKLNVIREEAVRTDHDVNCTPFQLVQSLFRFVFGTKTAQHIDSDREPGEALRECSKVLLREDGGRYKNGDLFAVARRFESRPYGYLGFAVPDVPTKEEIHRHGAFHESFDL